MEDMRFVCLNYEMIVIIILIMYSKLLLTPSM